MAYPKNGKPSKLVPIGRPKFSELKDDFKQAIVNHPDCKKVFEKQMSDARLAVSDHAKCVINAFNKLLPELSDTQLNVSEGEKEYTPLFNLLEKKYTGVYPVNTGLFILMMNLIRKQPGKLYAKNISERKELFVACDKISEEMKNMLLPLRDKCTEDFYASATQKQWDEIRDIVRHHADPKGAGMPGNGGMQQFGR